MANPNVIANLKLILSGLEIDATGITPDLISGHLYKAGGIQANVASGHHGIDFLL